MKTLNSIITFLREQFSVFLLVFAGFRLGATMELNSSQHLTI